MPQLFWTSVTLAHFPSFEGDSPELVRTPRCMPVLAPSGFVGIPHQSAG